MSTQQQPPDNPQRGALEPHVQMDALRLWLAGGIHKFAVDPRRRHGGHGRARRVLTEDHRALPRNAAGWESLASTLERHTVLSGMTELSPEERRVVTLAYLEGFTNRQIATSQGVSVTTVKRHLQGALKQLDACLARTGSWLSTILLVASAYLVPAAMRLGRSAGAGGSADWTPRLASTAAVLTLAAAIGAAAVAPNSTSPRRSSTPATIQAAAPLHSAGLVTARGWQQSKFTPGPLKIVVASDRSNASGPDEKSDSEQSEHSRNAKHGCGGNPANGPPAARGASKKHHPHGPPVTHPRRGACQS